MAQMSPAELTRTDLAALRLRQRDGVTCGPSVAVIAGALLDPGRRAALAEPASGSALFAAEQARVHAATNRVWPRRLGTTPGGMAAALTAQGATAGVPYRWRLFRGRRDPLTDVLEAVAADRPVAMLIGRLIPRHWVLIIGATGRQPDQLDCYEPTSGDVRTVPVAAVRGAELTGLGYPRPFAFVLPHSNV